MQAIPQIFSVFRKMPVGISTNVVEENLELVTVNVGYNAVCQGPYLLLITQVIVIVRCFTCNNYFKVNPE